MTSPCLSFKRNPTCALLFFVFLFASSSDAWKQPSSILTFVSGDTHLLSKVIAVLTFYLVIMIYFFSPYGLISTSRLSDVIVTRGRNRGHFSTEAALKQSEHWSFGDGRDLTGFQSDIHLSSHSCRTPHVFVRRKCSISKRQFSNCLRRFKWKSMGRRMEDNSGVLENSGFTRGSYSVSDNDVPTSLTNHRGRKHWS